MRVRDVCTLRKEKVSEKKIAGDTECVYSTRRTHSSFYYVGAGPCGYDPYY